MLELTRRKFFGFVAALLGTRKVVDAVSYRELVGQRYTCGWVTFPDVIDSKLLGTPVPIFYGKISDEDPSLPRFVDVPMRYEGYKGSFIVEEGDRIQIGLDGSFEILRS